MIINHKTNPKMHWTYLVVFFLIFAGSLTAGFLWLSTDNDVTRTSIGGPIAVLAACVWYAGRGWYVHCWGCKWRLAYPNTWWGWLRIGSGIMAFCITIYLTPATDTNTASWLAISVALVFAVLGEYNIMRIKRSNARLNKTPCECDITYSNEEEFWRYHHRSTPTWGTKINKRAHGSLT